MEERGKRRAEFGCPSRRQLEISHLAWPCALGLARKLSSLPIAPCFFSSPPSYHLLALVLAPVDPSASPSSPSSCARVLYNSLHLLYSPLRLHCNVSCPIISHGPTAQIPSPSNSIPSCSPISALRHPSLSLLPYHPNVATVLTPAHVSRIASRFHVRPS